VTAVAIHTAEEWIGVEQSPWDTFVCAGHVFPGLATVEAVENPGREYDKRRPRGAQRTRVVDTGPKLAKFKVTLRMWTDEQWQEWEQTSRLLTETFRQFRQRDAVTVAHPALAAVSVLQATFEEVGLPTLKSGQIEVSFVMSAHIPERANRARGNRDVRPPWLPPPAQQQRQQTAALAQHQPATTAQRTPPTRDMGPRR